jgi:hypothetical protein
MNRWHVLMGEFYGWLSAWALVQIAKHADKADDIVTVYRVRDVLAYGVDHGWDERLPDKGKIVPGRSNDIAAKIVADLAAISKRPLDVVGRLGSSGHLSVDLQAPVEVEDCDYHDANLRQGI